ncbi:RICIN domain-containing protein [Streptomyces sp. NBC_01693]|uniref:RICIN domain-containing protein n=1 Tax=Streptomyces sp. NBC_01693 TaxID=2975912 RepID=UPI002E31F4BB|nr:RICIN domain-containing protein [Streptomyces sp. NBC_01693]
MSVRRAVTMRGAAGDPGGALAPGGAQRGRPNASSAAATPDTAAPEQIPASKQPEKGPENAAPESTEPETTAPENTEARKKTAERTNADEATGTLRGIGAPDPSADGTSEPDAPSLNSAATSGGSAAAASSEAAGSAPPSPPAAVSTTGTPPDAAMAASAAGSGGAGASGSHAGDEPPGSRPKKPMLAAAAIVGAVLIAVPFLLAGQDDRKPEQPRTENAAGTVLDTERSAVPDTYTSASPVPSATPSKKKKEEEEEPPPAPVVQKQTTAPSPSASEKKPKVEKKAAVKELTAAEKLRQWANGRSGVQNTVLKNAATGQCVDIGGFGKGKINERVNQYPCNGTTADNQLWNLDIVDKDGGPQNAPLFLIRNSKDGFCLDLPYYTAKAVGTKVSEFHCNAAGDNQLWWLDPRGDGTNWIRNAVSNDLCLRPTGGAAAGNDARLEIAMCGYGDRWIV